MNMAYWKKLFGAAALSAALLTSTASSQGLGGNDPILAANRGWSMEQGRAAGWSYDQHTRLSQAVAALKPQRPGVVDAYILSVGLDSDAVFTREASEAAKVLSRRYDGEGRTLTLATRTDGAMPQGSPDMIAAGLAALSKKMDLKEDVLILFTTSHGDPNVGIVYRDESNGMGLIAPMRMAEMLNDLGFQKRMVIISACFSGVFVPKLENDNSIILTAASSTRSSFGCAASNDWTFFGDALMNHALRKPQPLEAAVTEAHKMINGWESGRQFPASGPQASYGKNSVVWLKALETRMPKDATQPIGKPANDFDK
jgi:hypothetical protein